MSGGRPRKMRVPGSGEKIQAALRVAGLTWSSQNTFAANHVLSNKRWKRCGLPRSASTIANDISLGVPLDRLEKYACFLGITPEDLSDEAVGPYTPEFSCKVLKNRHKLTSTSPLPVHSEDPGFCRLLAKYNSTDKLRELYDVLGGVFKLYLMEVNHSDVFRVAAHVYALDNNSMVLRGFIKMYGAEIELKGRLFCWGTFLHVNYFTDSGQLLGYVLLPAPSTSLISIFKSKFQLPLFGLAGSLLSPSVPDRLYGYAERFVLNTTKNDSYVFSELCKFVKSDPVVSVDDAEYGDVVDRIKQARFSIEKFHVV